MRYRAAVHKEQLHPTGLCGFVLDELSCPGLPSFSPVSVFEAGSNVLIYRRALVEPVRLRLFHLATEPVPVLGDLRALFQMSYSSMDVLGEESVISVLNVAFTDSLFVSGAILYPRFEPYLRAAGFRRSVLLCDPNRVFAAALLHLRRLGRFGGAEGGWRSLGRRGPIAAFAECDLTDPAAIGRALLRLSTDDARLLADPLTRMLSARSRDESLDDFHLGTALENLAGFEVIGFDDQEGSFVDEVCGLAGCTRAAAGARPLDPADFAAVTVAVAHCEIAQEYLQFDAALRSEAREAIARAATVGRF